MTDFALVVGIERYDSPFAPELLGPSFDALKFALWLRMGAGVPGENIIVLHNKSTKWSGRLEADYEKTLQGVLEQGIKPRETTSLAAIRQSWRQGVLEGPLENGTLWIYWSGHGVTFPRREEALLCSDLEAGNPNFVYLSELRDSLRSQEFARFNRQRIVVDACARHLNYEDLKIVGVRNPDSFAAIKEPEQIVLNAVPVGSKARAEEGRSLFTRVLVNRLEKSGWPEDIVRFFLDLSTDIEDEVPDATKKPRLRVFSPRFEGGILDEADRRHDEVRDILGVLARCALPYSRYQPHYVRTMGLLSSDPDVLVASSVTEMIKECLELPRQDEYGGVSRALVEWLSRVVRTFPDETAAIRAWLERVPTAAQLEINAALDREATDLALVFLIVESAASPHGLPATIFSYLCDAAFVGAIQTWIVRDIKSRSGVEEELRKVLCAAASLALQESANLCVHVFANPPFFDIAYHALRVDPNDQEDCSTFGELHPFFLRSRARLLRDDIRYNLDSWSKKVAILRLRPAHSITFHPAPAYSASARDFLAKIDGLLSIHEVFATSTASTADPPPVYKLLSIALRRGLPLVAWRTAPPEEGDWSAFEDRMRSLFKKCKLVGDVPAQLMDERRTEPWARETVLLWDDDDNKALFARLTEEPRQR